MTRFVLDSSVTMSWCFADEDDSYAMSVLDALSNAQPIVPWLWPLEVANVLAVGERKGRIVEADSARFLGMLASLPINIDDTAPARVANDILAFARSYSLSAYDACYIELAHREGLALATLDVRLRQVAVELGLGLVTF